ncbi:hypothetical protein [Streptomyces sp. ATCC 21386]|uniref:hypothetical protein n=1 Tax=Streptomyces sp. ATCC 21386 TaxID=2699428 RepID=UPI001BFFC2F5|nr:hypothetical protein [Streptomyces sp. ATCC 21386]
MGTEYTPADSQGKPASSYGETHSESEVTVDAAGEGYTGTSDYVDGKNALAPVSEPEPEEEEEEYDYGDDDDD